MLARLGRTDGSKRIERLASYERNDRRAVTEVSLAVQAYLSARWS